MTEQKAANHYSPSPVDVLIVGAGPCGLAVAARLREETPSAMFTDEEHQRYHWIKRHTGRMALVSGRQRMPDTTTAPDHLKRSKKSTGGKARPEADSRLSTLVLDSSGKNWLDKWNNSFRTLEIPQLRSPMFFHVDPGDRDGMLAYTRENDREDELWEIANCVGKELSKHRRKARMHQRPRVRHGSLTAEVGIDERDRKDYFAPSTGLFCDYCKSIIRRYGLDSPEKILQEQVTDISYDYIPELSQTTKLFTVKTSEGNEYRARAVVLAIGPGYVRSFPWNLSSEEMEGSCHSLDIRTFPSPSVKKKIAYGIPSNVVIIGGGLSSAHLADMAIRKGVTKVWFLVRGDLKVKPFDIDLNWMGKYKNREKAVFWSADTDEERLQLIATARGGGSMTPRMHKVLKHHIAKGRLSLHTHTEIISPDSASPSTTTSYDPVSKTWTVATNPPIPQLPVIDHIYFATGVKSDITSMPFLQTMHATYPIQSKAGLPCITDDLAWRHDVPVFLTGKFAALQLGPGAPNLEGARVGAERVAWSLQELLGSESYVDQEREIEETVSKWAFAGLGNRYAGLSVE